MYITLKTIKRQVGFKGIEATDLIIGCPLLFILLMMFSISSLRMFSIILFAIAVFMFLPINLSKKNRMYKVIFLVIKYLFKPKEYLYQKEDKEGLFEGIVKRKTRKDS